MDAADLWWCLLQHLHSWVCDGHVRSEACADHDGTAAAHVPCLLPHASPLTRYTVLLSGVVVVVDVERQRSDLLA